MTSDMLSQEEINALLNDNSLTDSNDSSSNVLSDTEKDTLGEIGNISMGTATTTLFTLLGQKVIITTPKVTITDANKLASEYTIPFVAVDVRYKLGLKGANLLILKCDDVKIITDLMMGGDGTNVDREINEMDLSAISEAMNQMIGSSCTSLSEMFSQKIDIEPPRAFVINFSDNKNSLDILNTDEPIVKISFKMVVGNIIDSEIMQLLPLSFAKEMVSKLLDIHNENNVYDLGDKDEFNVKEGALDNKQSFTDESNKKHKNVDKTIDESEKSIVNVKSASFKSFDDKEDKMYNESIGLVEEIPVEITAELGRTTKKIGEILEYGPGTIIELDKLVGEPLDIYANGKFIAKGEVVVIDDNFGIRITDITNPAKRLS